MKNDRLFQILYYLLEKRETTAPQLAGMLEVSVRTIYRDIEALTMAGIPISTSVGKGGGITLIEGYTMDKALFSDEEQNEILFAIQSLKATEQHGNSLISKVGSIFQKPSPNWIEVDFSRWGLKQTDHQTFDILKKSILQKRILAFLYSNTSGVTANRRVKPIRLIYKDKSWYLYGYCLSAEDYRIFKMNRIQNLTSTEEHFYDDFVDAPPLELPQTSTQLSTVGLKFSKTAAFRVYDEFDHSMVEPQPDGSLIVCADFPLDPWVVSYLFSFGTEVEILSPPDLRAELASYAERIYNHYKY